MHYVKSQLYKFFFPWKIFLSGNGPLYMGAWNNRTQNKLQKQNTEQITENVNTLQKREGSCILTVTCSGILVYRVIMPDLIV